MKKICFFVIILLVSGCAHNKDRVRVNLKEDPETIRCIMLTHTPIGTHSDDVLNFINKKLIRGAYVSADAIACYNKQQGVSYKRQGVRQEIGTQHINIILGGYGRNLSNLFLITTWVYVKWGFDEDDKLLDIVVLKEDDGP